MFRIKVFAFLLILAATPALAQVQVANKIIGQVGNKIILLSDLNEIYNQGKAENPSLPENAKCGIFYNLLAQQILIEQAGRDSVVVSDEEVESALDDRLRRMMQMYGSKEAFEEANGGRTIYQLKDEYRSFFKDKAIAEKMQGTLMDKIHATPQEIEAFFNSIPADSLPPYPATVEMGQIVIKPEVDPEVDQLAREKLEGIRKEIVENGKSFATMAGIYGMDATKDNGGELEINRKGVDPKFAAAAFRLQPGEISPVFKSSFGYHIVQMISRMGEDARVRHIIIIPEVTTPDLQKSLKKLDSIRADLVSGKISFQTAVGKYSTDEMSKMTGGVVTDNNGNSTLPIDALDGEMAKAVGEMKIGEYSQPQIFVEDPNTGARSTRILYLKNRTDPHILNMKDDYTRIQQEAVARKQGEFIKKWIGEHIDGYYIRIDPDFQQCEELQGWVKAAAKAD